MRSDSWKKEEFELLTRIFEKNTKKFILEEFKKAGFDRSWQSIYFNAKNLNIKRNPEIIKQEMWKGGEEAPTINPWTPAEDAILIQYYPTSLQKEIEEKLPGRTFRGIRGRALHLNLHRTKEVIDKDNIAKGRKTIQEKYGVNYSFQIDEVKKKSQETNLKKRGVLYPSQNAEVREKVRKTVQEKYGVDNVFQSEKIKEKIAKTNIDKFGVENPQQSQEIKNKTIETNKERYEVENPFQLIDRVQAGMIDKYGVKSPLQSSEIKEKQQATNIERYGVKVPAQNEDVLQKMQETNIDRYGTIAPFQNDFVKEKIKNVVKERYGVENIAQSEEIKEKIRKTCLKRYGVEYSIQAKSVREKGYETSKRNNSFSRSKEEEYFLDYLKVFDPDIKIQEKHPIIKHIMDYYMPKYDIWIQYDGCYWHGKTERANISSHSEKIKEIKKRDQYQNENIVNLVRFWSDEVSSAIKNNVVLNLIEDKLKSKTSKNIERTSFQYNKKQEIYKKDLENLNFDPSVLEVTDFNLFNEPLTEEISKFIEKYEWLGTIGLYPKWCFTARYNNNLGGVLLINEPAAYSKLLGSNTPEYEALIQRGATASWTPKNLGSRLIMFSCKWMVHNTSKRIFVAYGDEKAGEIGTLYQACGFEYLGKSFGNTYMYQNIEIKEGELFSAHDLKRTSSFRKWCKNNNISLQQEWFTATGFKNLDTIPKDIKEKWYSWIRSVLETSKKIEIEKKHKYVLVVGKNKKEKKLLNALKAYSIYPYPKRISL